MSFTGFASSTLTELVKNYRQCRWKEEDEEAAAAGGDEEATTTAQ